MKNVILAVGVALACAVATEAQAGTHYSGEFTYPGTDCRIFGSHPGVGPNSGAELGNWSSSSVSVFCPVPRDSAAAFWGSIYVDIRGGVTCTAVALLPSGSGWGYAYNTQTNQGSYTELYYWPEGYVTVAGAALQCTIPGGGAILSSYRVGGLWMDH